PLLHHPLSLHDALPILVVAGPIDCLVLEESLLHEISKSVPFSFDLYLQQPLCPFQNVYFKFVALASERKSSATPRLSPFLQTLQDLKSTRLNSSHYLIS